MSQTIQMRRGTKANLPILNEGEFAFCTDTKEVYIGDGVDNINISQSQSKTYTHTQLTSSANWTINHNLGKKPSVIIVDSAGTEVIGDVKYTDDNQLVISFTSGFAGYAYLN